MKILTNSQCGFTLQYIIQWVALWVDYNLMH